MEKTHVTTREHILTRIDAFREKHNMTAWAFGQQAVKDHKFVGRLREGFGVTLTSIEKAETFMDEYAAPAATGEATA